MNNKGNKPLLVPLSDIQEKTAEWLIGVYAERADQHMGRRWWERKNNGLVWAGSRYQCRA